MLEYFSFHRSYLLAIVYENINGQPFCKSGVRLYTKFMPEGDQVCIMHSLLKSVKAFMYVESFHCFFHYLHTFFCMLVNHVEQCNSSTSTVARESEKGGHLYFKLLIHKRRRCMQNLNCLTKLINVYGVSLTS